jgi:hypothetical protein
MTIRRVPEITAEQENRRTVPLASGSGFNMVTSRVDPVEPVPVGTYIAMVFRVTGYDRDCDGSLMARLASVDAEGEETGWETDHHGLYPNCDWVLGGPGDLDVLAEGTARDA